MKRIRLGIIYGGRSGEHEVSVRSALSIVDHIDRDKYSLVLIGIDPKGHWHHHSERAFRNIARSSAPRVSDVGEHVAIPPSPIAGSIIPLAGLDALPSAAVDVIFPVLHGPYGEDGTIQGLLDLADLPYVGAGVLGSALGMDKDVQKRLLRDAEIPVVDFAAIRRVEWAEHQDDARRRIAALGFPLFVKPANLGSSVGITRVSEADQITPAVSEAFSYDHKIVVERGIDAREIECSVLGNELPEASVPGEVRPRTDFYSYTAKYMDAHGATFEIPAKLPRETARQLRELAIRAFRTIECEGMARVDFFLERTTHQLFVNELNTIPGFTAISQYPRLWEASGLPYTQLIDRLITLAFERHDRRRRLRTSYTWSGS